MAADIVSEIAASTVHHIGGEYLQALVRSLRSAMDVDAALVTAGIGKPPKRARSVACWKDGSPSKNVLEYDLEGTPCRMVYQGETVIVPKRLYEKFPADAVFEGYIGLPLRGSSQGTLGHLAVLSRQPLREPEAALSILKLFALRAEAELEREVHDRERETLIASLTRANKRISRRHAELRKVNDMKMLLLGTMAHDLRNPLATIMGRGELIAEILDEPELPGPNASKARESCAIIMRAAERMDRSIASMLSQAQEDAGRIHLDLHPAHLRQIADIALGLNAEAARKKSIALINEVPHLLSIVCDEDKLVEALDNFIHNAIKYSRRGQSVSVQAEQETGYYRVHVKDEGVGMTEDDLARAFRPFQRLSSTPTEGESSTGLGLSIVKTIAEAHGGHVSASSPGQDKGSTFTLTLPFKGI